MDIFNRKYDITSSNVLADEKHIQDKNNVKGAKDIMDLLSRLKMIINNYLKNRTEKCTQFDGVNENEVEKYLEYVMAINYNNDDDRFKKCKDDKNESCWYVLPVSFLYNCYIYNNKVIIHNCFQSSDSLLSVVFYENGKLLLKHFSQNIILSDEFDNRIIITENNSTILCCGVSNKKVISSCKIIDQTVDCDKGTFKFKIEYLDENSVKKIVEYDNGCFKYEDIEKNIEKEEIQDDVINRDVDGNISISKENKSNEKPIIKDIFVKSDIGRLSKKDVGDDTKIKITNNSLDKNIQHNDDKSNVLLKEENNESYFDDMNGINSSVRNDNGFSGVFKSCIATENKNNGTISQSKDSNIQDKNNKKFDDIDDIDDLLSDDDEKIENDINNNSNSNNDKNKKEGNIKIKDSKNEIKNNEKQQYLFSDNEIRTIKNESGSNNIEDNSKNEVKRLIDKYKREEIKKRQQSNNNVVNNNMKNITINNSKRQNIYDGNNNQKVIMRINVNTNVNNSLNKVITIDNKNNSYINYKNSNRDIENTNKDDIINNNIKKNSKIDIKNICNTSSNYNNFLNSKNMFKSNDGSNRNNRSNVVNILAQANKNKSDSSIEDNNKDSVKRLLDKYKEGVEKNQRLNNNVNNNIKNNESNSDILNNGKDQTVKSIDKHLRLKLKKIKYQQGLNNTNIGNIKDNGGGIKKEFEGNEIKDDESIISNRIDNSSFINEEGRKTIESIDSVINNNRESNAKYSKTNNSKLVLLPNTNNNSKKRATKNSNGGHIEQTNIFGTSSVIKTYYTTMNNTKDISKTENEVKHLQINIDDGSDKNRSELLSLIKDLKDNIIGSVKNKKHKDETNQEIEDILNNVQNSKTVVKDDKYCKHTNDRDKYFYVLDSKYIIIVDKKTKKGKIAGYETYIHIGLMDKKNKDVAGNFVENGATFYFNGVKQIGEFKNCCLNNGCFYSPKGSVFIGEGYVKNKTVNKTKVFKHKCGVERNNNDIKFIFINGEKFSGNGVGNSYRDNALEKERTAIEIVDDTKKKLKLNNNKMSLDIENKTTEEVIGDDGISKKIDDILELFKKNIIKSINNLNVDDSMKQKEINTNMKIINKVREKVKKCSSFNYDNTNNCYFCKVDDKNTIVVDLGTAPTIYCGGYSNGKRNGVGIKIDPFAGSAYCGNWSNNFKNGVGLLFDCFSGKYCKYKGSFKEGLFDGCGILNNDKYSKDWSKGGLLGRMFKKHINGTKVEYVKEYTKKDGKNMDKIYHHKYDEIQQLCDEIKSISAQVKLEVDDIMKSI